jgi:hypothetical protein
MICSVLNRLSTEKGLRNNSSIQSLKIIIRIITTVSSACFWVFTQTKHKPKENIRQNLWTSLGDHRNDPFISVEFPPEFA